MALLRLFIDVVLVWLVVFWVNVERCFVMTEHLAEFVSHELTNIIGIGALKTHVKPSV